MMDIKLYNMDCAVGMKQLEDDCIDLTVTSPPYDNLRTYNKSSTWNFEIFKPIAQELYRVTKQGGVVVWIVCDATIKGSETGTSFRQALYFMECGFNLHDTMIWNKQSMQFPDKIRYYNSFEYMFVFTKGKIKSFNPIADKANKHGGVQVHGTLRKQDGTLTTPTGFLKKRRIKDVGIRFNVWNISPERNNESEHPAVFPQQIAHDHIISWSNENDTVLDPFMGSGTTGISCIKTNRNYTGFEIDKEYYEVSCKRLEEYKSQTRWEL